MTINRKLKIMNNQQAGFTLTELLITMVVFVLAIAAASQIFTGLLTQFKQQSKIAETNIEGIVGLEILRQDLEHAGYGLPWVIPSGVGVTYSEATSTTKCGTADPSTYNDSTTTDPPKAIVSGDNNCTNGSDYLVIKAVNIARNDASKKSTRLISTSPYARTWTPSGENLASTDRVIVINPGASTNQGVLITDGATFFTTYGNVTNPPWRPLDNTQTRIVYGIDPNTNPRMPFNRADYYISIPATNFPSRCATGTGILYKGVVNQSNGNISNPLPLLDCVADMQVIYRGDRDNDGILEWTNDNIGALTDSNGNGRIDAQEIREQVKEVRVYILAHEGQKDPNYTYPTNPVTVGEFGLGHSVGSGTGFNFTTAGITDWQNYRWKIYTIVVKPENLSKK